MPDDIEKPPAPPTFDELIAAIQQTGREAKERTEETVDRFGVVHVIRKPDFGTALRAHELIAKLLYPITQRHEVKVSAAEMTEEQLRDALLDHISKRPELQEALVKKGIALPGVSLCEKSRSGK